MTIDLRLGNVIDVLRTLPSGSVHTIVTSPPYWGLRAYGTEPQIWLNGNEPCREHEWGDGHTHNNRADYAMETSGKQATNKGSLFSGETNTCTHCGAWRGELGLEPMPELYVEHIVAVMREARRVLRDDGTMWLNIGDSYASNWGMGAKRDSSWWSNKSGDLEGKGWGTVETAIPPNSFKSKGNGLKVKDLVGIPWRVAFALQADGWYLRSDIIWHKPNPMPESVRDRPTKAHEYIFLMAKQVRYYYDAEAVAESSISPGSVHVAKSNQKMGIMSGIVPQHNIESKATRNRRSVWTVTTHPFKGAHFATFPPKLIEPCILAGCPPGGTVLDPFNGAGTTGLVALQHGRNYIGIDLKQEYLDMTRRRLDGVQVGFSMEDSETQSN